MFHSRNVWSSYSGGYKWCNTIYTDQDYNQPVQCSLRCEIMLTCKSAVLPACFSSSSFTSRSFVGIFPHGNSDQSNRKYVPRHIWPMCVVNVLMCLEMLHCGLFHQLINWFGTERTVWREKAEKYNNVEFLALVWTKLSELQPKFSTNVTVS